MLEMKPMQLAQQQRSAGREQEKASGASQDLKLLTGQTRRLPVTCHHFPAQGRYGDAQGAPCFLSHQHLVSISMTPGPASSLPAHSEKDLGMWSGGHSVPGLLPAQLLPCPV